MASVFSLPPSLCSLLKLLQVFAGISELVGMAANLPSENLFFYVGLSFYSGKDLASFQ
jgi:hypothetical protein